MTPPLVNVGACVFDAYGTLFDLSSIAGPFRGALGERTDAFAAVWRAKQLDYAWLRTLMGRYEDFWHVTGEALDFALDWLGIDDPPLRSRLMERHLNPSAYPDAAEALDRLRAAGLTTAILSNGSPTMLAAAVAGAGLRERIDLTLSVDAVHVYKPHPAAYQLACDRLRIEPGRIGFVSSNTWDVAGAACFGLRAVWLNRTGQRWERLPASPHAEITSLADLPEQVVP